MTIAIRRRVGKAVFTIAIEGCVECGTKTSHAWRQDRDRAIAVTLDDGTYLVKPHVCGTCDGIPVPEGA